MDIATLIGLMGGLAIVLAAILLGGSAGVFLNTPSLLIVLGGTSLVVLMKFSLPQFLGAFKVATRAFVVKLESPEDIIPEVISLAEIARREGLLGLEMYEIKNSFLKSGVDMLIDGAKPEIIRQLLEKDLRQTLDRHRWGAMIFSASGDVAPAMGMIGTLIGLVQMLSSMDDPKAIGPAMAVALLTTLYGAIFANMIAIPIADKLKLRMQEEGRLKTICIDGVLGIGEGQNPRILESILKTYLSPQQRMKPPAEEAEEDSTVEMDRAA